MNRKTALLAMLALAAVPLWGPPDGLPPTAASIPLGTQALRPHESRLYWAVLDAGQESIRPNSGAGGWALFTVDDAGAISYRVSNWGVEGTAAHIHNGGFGTDGPVAYALDGGADSWQGKTQALDQDALGRLATGKMYVNVHSAAYPMGEIRGQILPMPSLFGSPPDGAPPTRGTDNGLFWLETDGSLSYRVETGGADSARLTSGSATVFDLGAGPSFGGQSKPLDDGALQALLTCGLQVEIDGPAGSRTLSVRALPNLFFATLSGDQEGPPVETDATASAYFLLLPNGQLTYRVAPSGLAVTAAHLHAGRPGRNGPPVFHLVKGAGGMAGIGDLDRGTVNALMRGGVYLNLHSADHPGGEIRGQLAPVVTPFMNGCAPKAAF